MTTDDGGVMKQWAFWLHKRFSARVTRLLLEFQSLFDSAVVLRQVEYKDEVAAWSQTEVRLKPPGSIVDTGYRMWYHSSYKHTVATAGIAGHKKTFFSFVFTAMQKYEWEHRSSEELRRSLEKTYRVSAGISKSHLMLFNALYNATLNKFCAHLQLPTLSQKTIWEHLMPMPILERFAVIKHNTKSSSTLFEWWLFL